MKITWNKIYNKETRGIAYFFASLIIILYTSAHILKPVMGKIIWYDSICDDIAKKPYAKEYEFDCKYAWGK